MAWASRMSWRKDSMAMSARVGMRRFCDGGAEGIPCGLAGFKRQTFQSFKRGFADAASRGVDHPLQSH